MSPRRQQLLQRVGMVGQCGLLALCAAWAVYERPAPVINVRWREGLSREAQRLDEQQFYLASGDLASGSANGTTWTYVLTAPTRTNIAALIAHADVEDTFRIDRRRATISDEAGRSPVRVWWAGPLRGVNGRRMFRVALLVLSLVTVTSAMLSRPRRRRH